MQERSLREVAVDALTTAEQVRKDSDEDALKGLAESIKSQGLLQPLLVRQEGKTLVVVDGERRLRALKLAGVKTVWVIIESAPLEKSGVLQRQLVANLQRADLSAMEKARAVSQLLHESGKSGAEVASMLGISASAVSRLLALLALPSSVQEKVERGDVPASTAYEIARAGTAAEQERLADEAASGILTRDAASGRNRARRAPSGSGGREVSRFTGKLPGGRMVTASGAGLTSVDDLISWLGELAARARKSRGIELSTFAQLLKDEAKAGATP